VLELPECHAAAIQLTKTVGGKEVDRAVAARSKHGFAWYSAAPEEYSANLKGLTVEGAREVAAYVELMLSGGMLLAFRDGINLRFLNPGEKVPDKHQLLIGFSDGSHLVCTVQMYGGMWMFKDGEKNDRYYLAARENPTPLEEGFDYGYFKAICERENGSLSVKALLATEQRIPGLGNGTLQDILFNARINPQSRLFRLDEGDVRRLYEAVRQTLASMAEGGGRNTEKDLFGNYGGYECVLSNRTAKNPCPVCGGSITKKSYLGGSVYYCDNCQPVLK